MEDDFMYLPAPLSVENELNLEEAMNAQQSNRQYETTTNQQMDPKVEHYISKQPSNRQSIMTNIHSIIVQEDRTIVPVVELMMGKEMIVYKGKGIMKYTLAISKIIRRITAGIKRFFIG